MVHSISDDLKFGFDMVSLSAAVRADDNNWSGRYTISPDNVAKKALYGGPLALVPFYNDGSRIDQDGLSLMEKLMKIK